MANAFDAVKRLCYWSRLIAQLAWERFKERGLFTMGWRGEYPGSSWLDPDFYSVTDEERSEMIQYDILRVRKERKKEEKKEPKPDNKD
jgi:hypothetical protein